MDILDSDDDDLFKALSTNQAKKTSKKKTLDILMGDDETEKDLFTDDGDFSCSVASAFSLSKETPTLSIFTCSGEDDGSDDEKGDILLSSEDKSKESDDDDFFTSSTDADIFGTTKPIGLDFGLGQEDLFGCKSTNLDIDNASDSGDDQVDLSMSKENAGSSSDEIDPADLYSGEVQGRGNDDIIGTPHNSACLPHENTKIKVSLEQQISDDQAVTDEILPKHEAENRALSGEEENTSAEDKTLLVEPITTAKSDHLVVDFLESSDTRASKPSIDNNDGSQMDPEKEDVHPSDSTSDMDTPHDCSDNPVKSLNPRDDEHTDHAKTADSARDELTPNQSDNLKNEEPTESLDKIKYATSKKVCAIIDEQAEESRTTSELQQNSDAEESPQSGAPKEEVDLETEQMIKCCKCDLLSLPIGEMVKKKILDLSGKNLALEDLVAILEKESVQQREQFTAERQKIAGLQETIFDLKAQLTEQTRICEEYQAKCEQVEESLIGTRKMVTVLEEQLSTANSYKSGVDYMLESQLAQGRMAAAEARAQAAQHELLQSQDEIKRLLENLSKVNQEKREMVSLDVHQELMKISDEKSREMELAVLQLKSENSIMKRELEELKEVNSKTSTSSPSVPGYQIGDWNRALLEQKMKETSEMISYKTMFSDNYMRKADEILTSVHKKQPIAKPTPLMAAMISDQSHDHDKKPVSEDSDSDWSSDSNTDKQRPTSLPSSPAKTATDVILEARAALHKTPAKKPPVAQKPKLAPKPGLPPKPQKPAKPAKAAKPKPDLRIPVSSSQPAKAQIESPLTSPLVPQEKPVSFEEVAIAPALKVIRRPLGPKGRRRPKAA